MSLPKPRPVCLRRLDFGALLLLSLAGSASAITLLDPAAVSTAAEYSVRHHGVSFLAIQDGRTLVEQNAKTPHKIYSGTKAFWDLTALAAAEDGLLNLDERVAETITSWRNDPRKAQMTIRQLLDFDSGLEPQFFLHETQSGDRDAAAMRARAVAEPGRAFIYGPAALQVFHQVLKEKLRADSPTHYLERRVLHRLGLGSQRYLTDSAGNPLLAAGWLLSARQWAKLGEVALNGGAPIVGGIARSHCRERISAAQGGVNWSYGQPRHLRDADTNGPRVVRQANRQGTRSTRSVTKSCGSQQTVDQLGFRTQITK